MKWKLGLLLILLLLLLASPLSGSIKNTVISLVSAEKPPRGADLSDYRATVAEPTEQEFLVNGWIRDLGWCESRNKQNAINPKDNDGLSSFGKYQFRMGTFRLFMRKYFEEMSEDWESADWENNLMSGDAQEMILRKMIQDPNVNLRKQFPGCIKKLGLPPQ